MQAKTSPPSTADYRSSQFPQDFAVDWKSFYPEAWKRGQVLRSRYRHEIGVRYGADDAMVMNIFFPERPREDGTVFVYMHGGAFVEGHPDFADFAGERLLPEGITFVSMGYRLAPTRFPDSASDVASGLAFLERHLATRWSGKRRYCLAGHSAGAGIAALVGVRPELTANAGLPKGMIDSLVLISGIYEYEPWDPSHSFVEPARRREASAVAHAAGAPRKTLIVYGDPEPNRTNNRDDVFKLRSVMMEGALKAHGRPVMRLELPGADHVATGCALADDRVFSAVMEVLAV